jgi:P-loop Domain of unknown function (DUF2791)
MTDLSRGAARTLVRGLQRGTVRPGGAKYFHKGHEGWIAAQLEEFEEISDDGGAVVHFVRGAYGEGKTHFLHYLEELARDRGWATAHLECRHDKVELDRFETIYPSIIQKLRLFPDLLDNEEEVTEDPAHKLLNVWAEKHLRKVGFARQSVVRPFEVELRLFELLQEEVMTRNLPGDLQSVLCAFPRAVFVEDYNAQRDLIGWLKGENRTVHFPSSLLTKPGQRVKAPGVDRLLINPVTLRPVTSGTSLDVFRGLVWVLTKCDFKGLILSIDEVEMIAQLKQALRRERALQTLREFVDNTDGDTGLRRVAVYFAATPNMFDDEKYFRKYDALATRIEPVSGEINWRAPVIDLGKTMLTKPQLRWVADRIRWIFGVGYPEAVGKLSDDSLGDLVDTVDKSRYRIAKPRLLCRALVDQLERLRQGKGTDDAAHLVARTATKLIEESEA